MVGMLDNNGYEIMHEQSRRVYSANGAAPTLHTCGGEQQELKIAVSEATQKGYDEATYGDSINIAYPNSKTRRGRVGHGVAQTLTTGDIQQVVVEPVIVEDFYKNREAKPIEQIAYDEQNGYLRQDGTVGTLTTDGNSPKHNNRIVEINYGLSESMKRYINSTNEKYKVSDSNLMINRDIACTKTTREGRTRADASDYISPNLPSNANVSGIDLMQYRIRKLTERECFKLMGVKNDDYKNVAKNQSSSSLYHLAGDSIVTSCLMAIFGELFGVDYNDKINNLVKDLKENKK